MSSLAKCMYLLELECRLFQGIMMMMMMIMMAQACTFSFERSCWFQAMRPAGSMCLISTPKNNQPRGCVSHSVFEAMSYWATLVHVRVRSKKKQIHTAPDQTSWLSFKLQTNENMHGPHSCCVFKTQLLLKIDYGEAQD